jgi:outer membrane protein TolC
LKKLVLSIGVVSTLIYSSTVSLEEIISNAKPSEIIKEKITQKRLFLENENSLSNLAEPLTIESDLARKNGDDLSGFEYEIGFSKQIFIGESQKLREKENRLNYEAELLEEQLEIIDIENWIKDLYHQHCLDDAYLENFQEVYQKFLELYEKKQIAFSQGEIAKTELLQLKLEMNRLKIELENRVTQEKSSRELLLSLTNLPQDSMLLCSDIYPIRAEIEIKQQTFAISQMAYEKRVESINTGVKRYNQNIDSIELLGGYAKELDSKIYSIGVSVPLNFTTKKREYAKASLKHKSLALELEHEQKIGKKSYEVRRLYQKLKQDALIIEAKNINIDNYKTTLLPLMKKSYDYGESSVIEYLLSQQKLYAMQEELLNKKRDYYHTLFQLYTITEIKDKQ